MAIDLISTANDIQVNSGSGELKDLVIEFESSSKSITVNSASSEIVVIESVSLTGQSKSITVNSASSELILIDPLLFSGESKAIAVDSSTGETELIDIEPFEGGRVASISVQGNQLHFTDGEKNEFYYLGVKEDGVDLTENIGILGNKLLYKDEEGQVRKLKNNKIGTTDISRGRIWVLEKGNELVYVDEDRNKNIAYDSIEVV